MTANRVLVLTVSLLTALLLQTTVLSRLAVLRARPDLVLVVVVCFALAAGPGMGMTAGFAAGLAADLLSDHVLGLLALVYCVTGYSAGVVRAYLDRLATTTPMLFVGVAAAGATTAFAGLSALLGDARVGSADLVRAVGLGSLYDVALTPFVFSAVSALLRRTETGDRW